MNPSRPVLNFLVLGLVLLTVFGTSIGLSAFAGSVVGEFAGKPGVWTIMIVTMTASMLLLGKLVLQPFYAMAGTEGVSAEKGRSILVAYVTVILLLSAMNVLPSVLFGFAEVLESLALPALAIVLFFWLFQGSKGARWVIVIGCVLLGGLFGVMTIASLPAGASVAILLPAGMAAVVLSFAVVLVASKSVNAFLESRRQRTNVP